MSRKKILDKNYPYGVNCANIIKNHFESFKKNYRKNTKYKS